MNTAEKFRKEDISPYVIRRKIESQKCPSVYDPFTKEETVLDGYLVMKSGLICPLIFNRMYMIKALVIVNSKIIISNKLAGFMFYAQKEPDDNKFNSARNAVLLYNKKVDGAIREHNPRKEFKFQDRFIHSFRLL